MQQPVAQQLVPHPVPQAAGAAQAGALLQQAFAGAAHAGALLQQAFAGAAQAGFALQQALAAGAQHCGAVVQQEPQHGGLMVEQARWYVCTEVPHGRVMVGLQQTG